MRCCSIFIFVFIYVNGLAQSITVEPGLRDSTDAIITSWMNDTEVFFPVYSLNPDEWKKMPLNQLLRFTGKANDEYVFVILEAANDPNYPGSIEAALSRLEKGIIDGRGAIEQLFLKLNLTAKNKYQQDMIFLTSPANSSQQAVFFWKEGLMAEISLPAPTGTKGGSVQKTYKIPSYVESKLLRSNSLRDYVDVPDSMLTLSVAQYDELASKFLSVYFKTRYGSKAVLVYKAPPTVELDRVKGYISGADGYWEKVQIKLDNIQRADNRLLIQCTLDGAYIKIKTPAIEPSAFERPYILENDYQRQVNACGLEIIAAFKTYILQPTKNK